LKSYSHANKEANFKAVEIIDNMIDLKKFQKEVYQNKIDKGFNVTDIFLEFCYTQKELSEAFEAYNKKLPDLGEELADVMIYLLGMAEILDIDLEKEITKKHEKNKARKYTRVDGVNTRIQG